MAAFTVHRVKSATLGVATVDTVTLDGFGVGVANRVAIFNKDPTSPIYFTLDGSTPTVAGDECYCVPVNSSVRLGFLGGAIKLIAAAAAAYTVQAE